MVELYLFASLRSKWQQSSKTFVKESSGISKTLFNRKSQNDENIKKNYNSGNKITKPILVFTAPLSFIRAVCKLYNLRHIRD